jgi:hypothetical protein
MFAAVKTSVFRARILQILQALGASTHLPCRSVKIAAIARPSTHATRIVGALTKARKDISEPVYRLRRDPVSAPVQEHHPKEASREDDRLVP